MTSNKDLKNDKYWYKDAIIYELHIKAFRDSNGDGVGDFQGLMEKLDYLQELGVTAIWVLPFYPSPLRDDGYDIADYYTINPNYGTLEEFRHFLDEAHKRDLKVITELVINHTSDQHPWFQRARSAPKGSPERDFYVWSDDPGKYKDVRIIFQDFEASNWSWDPVADQYYWHRFFHHQPDLNFDNPLVQAEIFRIIDYWCAMGVDGFRLDAVPYLFEREGTNGENLPETHAFLKALRKHVEEKFPQTVFLAEANMWPEDSASYFGNGDECHMNYHFPVMPRMFMALQQEDRYPITDIFDQTPEIPESCQWAMFLRNHDELTLEMVTDEERDFMYKVYAKDPKARINLGIRHRLAPLMDNNRRKIELMNSLLFSLPGTPVIYYGDEIGMGDNFYLGDRDGVRTPMQWSADRNAGFSDANPHRLYLPVILDPEYHYESVNVEKQQRNTSSLFWFMKGLIHLRKSFRSFSRGDMKFLNVENPKVLAFVRSHEEETVLVVVNLSKYAQPAEVDLKAYKGFSPMEVFSKNRFPAIREDSPYFFSMGPHSFQWFLLQKTHTKMEDKRVIPEIELDSMEEFMGTPFRKQLESNILPQFLRSRPWFTGRNRKLHNLTMHQPLLMPGTADPLLFVLLEASYESGLPETYQLALSFITEMRSKEISDPYPEAIIAQMRIDGQSGFLCDAFYLPSVQERLFRMIAGKETLMAEGGTVYCHTEEPLYHFLDIQAGLEPKLHLRNEHNTSITYGQRFFLKMYRKVEANVNPDVELSRHLSGRSGYEFTPRFIGTIEWRAESGQYVLGMLQELVENHGDGYSFLFERVNNYIERFLAQRPALPEHQHWAEIFRAPVSFDTLTEAEQLLLGGHAADQVRLIGTRTAELHKALSTGGYDKDFATEEFSLHYQRSLFSSMQSLVRETVQLIERLPENTPTIIRDGLKEVQEKKQELLQLLKRVYEKKLDVVKIRNHGNFGLHQVLLTGKDVSIHDFGGNAIKTYSERRLKRSPLRDIAQMICALHYVAYDAFVSNNHIAKDKLDAHLPFLQHWASYMSGFFLESYLQHVSGTALIPKDPEDRTMLLETFLLERALKHLVQDLRLNPERAIVPLSIIRMIK